MCNTISVLKYSKKDKNKKKRNKLKRGRPPSKRKTSPDDDATSAAPHVDAHGPHPRPGHFWPPSSFGAPSRRRAQQQDLGEDEEISLDEDPFMHILGVASFIPRLPDDFDDKDIDAALAEIHVRSRPLRRLPPANQWSRNAQNLINLLLQTQGPFASFLQQNLDQYLTDNSSQRQFTQAILYLLGFFTQVLLVGSHLRQKPTNWHFQHTDGTSQACLLQPLNVATAPLPPSQDDPLEDDEAARSLSPLQSLPPSQQSEHSSPPLDVALQISEARALKSATAAANQDKLSLAARTLFGNGLAPPNKDTAQVMRDMHPDRDEDADQLIPPPSTTNLNISLDTCRKQLFSAASQTNASLDVFGWDPTLFFPIRSLPDTQNHPSLFMTVTRLISLVAQGKVPPPVARCLTAGTLVAANKVSEAEQFTRISNGQQQKLRPINNGCLILKTALRVASATSSAQKAIQKLRPIQLGLGAPAGPETLAHTARAAYNARALIGINDAANAFNAIKRQSILDGIHRMWPEGTDLINTYYGSTSPCFYKWQDEQEAHILSIIPSKEGARMGCVLGSLAYDCAVHPVYSELATKFPRAILRALTDDLTNITPVFKNDDGSEDWPATYTYYASYRQKLKALYKPLGISLNDDKSAILVPADAPDPDPALEISHLVTRDGIVLAGAPIGTDDFVKQHVNSKIKEILGPVRDRLGLLADEQPQIALRILSQSVHQRLSYLFRVCPPTLISEQIKELDKGIWLILRRVLYYKDVVPDTTKQRRRRAQYLASLPTKVGGLGLTLSKHSAPVAYLASLAASADSLHALDLRAHLAIYAAPAYGQVLTHIGGREALTANEALSKLVPPNADAVSSGGFYLSNDSTRKNFHKIQSAILHVVNTIRTEDYRDMLAQDPTITTNPERAHALAVSLRSQSTRVLVAPLIEKQNRIDALAFRDYMCFHLGLPKTTRSGASINSPLHGCDVDICRHCQDKNGNPHDPIVLDPTGNHASSTCPCQAAPKLNAHNGINDVILKASKEAGCTTAKREPETYMILGAGITRKQGHALFPKQQTNTAKATAARAQDLLVAATTAQRRGNEAEATEKWNKLREISDNLADDIQDRRPDAYLIAPSGEERIIDVSVRHITSPTYVDKTCKFMCKLRTAHATALQNGTANPLLRKPTPALASAETLKNTVYTPLTHMTALLKRNGLRKEVAKFLPCIISHEGEFAPGCFELIEWLTAVYKRECTKEGPRADGLTPSQLTAAYRSRLKNHLISALVQGFGNMLVNSTAGFAFT